MNKDKLLILTGRSASGKDSVLNELVKNYDFNRVITYTTRPMREHEKNGVEYYFTNKNIFTDMIDHGDLVEYRSYETSVNGNSDTWYYGLGKEQNNMSLNKNNVCILDYNGANNAINYFGSKNCIIVYLDVDEDIRTTRAKQRGSFDEIEWNRRLQADEKDFELSNIKFLADLIICANDLTIKEICDIIVNTMKDFKY